MAPKLASQINNQVQPTVVKCVFALLFGVAVLLSSVDGNLEIDSRFPDNLIVPAFKIGKPVSNILQFQDDIFDEIGAPNTKNLFVSLTNSKGSTVVPPTIVQSSVLNSAGNTPSMERLKQLAQNITSSPNKNLGLIGKVKKVSLSRILKHSLYGGGTPLPSPAPLPKRHNHHKHHRHRDRAPSPNYL